jgi:hypothetical protein
VEVLLNPGQDLAEIRKQVIEALSLSRENVLSAVQNSDLDLKYDMIWRAYSQIELGIGLAKLSYPDQIKEEIDRLHGLKHLNNRNSKRTAEYLNSRLDECKALLEQTISKFQDASGAETGIEKAREARDILKLLVLEENVSRTRRTKAGIVVAKKKS